METDGRLEICDGLLGGTPNDTQRGRSAFASRQFGLKKMEQLRIMKISKDHREMH